MKTSLRTREFKDLDQYNKPVFLHSRQLEGYLVSLYNYLDLRKPAPSTQIKTT